MSHPLPRLRTALDFLPSPAPDQPGLFIRDPYRYSDAMLVVPPVLIECLRCFDGRQTDLDLRALLVRITGDIQIGELERHLTQTLSSAGFLEDEVFARMKAARQRGFAEAPRREAVHAGAAYPLEIAALRQTMTRYMDGASNHSAVSDHLAGIAAPHVSPEGGWQSYRAAYQALGPELKDRTFVILATSHYGEPEHFGLTRKPFVTPFGETATNTALVDRLAAYETGERGHGDPSRWQSERDLEWVALRPELIVEVTFDHASGGRIRHGTKILRWREDKPPRECALAQMER